MAFKIKRPHEAGKPVSTTVELAGQIMPVELVPLPEKEFLKVLQPFRKLREVQNKLERKTELIPYFDDKDPKFQEASDNLLDENWVSFTAEEEDGTAVQVTRANKILLGDIRFKTIQKIKITDVNGDEAIMEQEVETTVRSVILAKMQELARATVAVEKEAEKD